jgi:hypothetical protein
MSPTEHQHPAPPVAIETEEDLLKYLDSDPEGQTIHREEYVDPETDFEKSDIKAVGLCDPKIKIGVIVALAIATCLGVMNACGRSGDGATTQTAQETELKKQNELLKKQVAQLQTVGEGAAQKRQAAGYLTPPKKPPVSKAVPKTVAAAVPVSYNQSSRNYNPDPDPAPVSVPLPKAIAAAAPVTAPESKAENAEITALREQLKVLQAKALKGDKPEPEQIATSLSEEVNPNALVEVLDTSQSQPVAQFDGGIEQQALLSGVAPVTIPVGTEAIAQLDTPIQSGAGPSQAMLTLKNDVKGEGDRVIIPRGSKLMARAEFSGAMANLTIESAMVNGLAIKLPNGIAVFKDDKTPLIATDFTLRSGGPGMGNIFLNALLDGASSGIQQVIQPDTSSVISGNNIIQNSTSSGRGLQQAGLAGLGGLTSGLSSGLKANLAAGLSAQQQGQGQSSAPALGIKAGINVRLVFMAPTKLVVPGTIASANLN